MKRTRGRRIGIAVASALLILVVQLWPPFMENAYGPLVGVMTLITVVVVGLRTSGLIVGPVMVALTPALAIIARWEVERQNHAFRGTSDFVDGMVMFGFGVCAPAGIAFGAGLDGRRSNRLPVFAMIASAGAFLAVLAAIVRAFQHKWVLGAGDWGVCGLGVVVAIVLALRGLTVPSLASDARRGQHRGDGWIDLDVEGAGEATPPVHHAPLAGKKAGPVIVTGLVDSKAGDYRAGSAQSVQVIEGGLTEHLDETSRTTASYFLLATASMFAGALKVFALLVP